MFLCSTKMTSCDEVGRVIRLRLRDISGGGPSFVERAIELTSHEKDRTSPFS